MAEAAGDERVKPELLQSVLEVATTVGRDVGEAIDEARELRARLRAAAAEGGTLIASAGTHPFSRYEHQDVTDAPRYTGLMEKMQWIAERELIFGLHVHVGMRSGDEAIWVANALRTWLPELLALSVNSPFWQARDTGLASTRIKVFDPFPRSGLPPTFASFADFEALVERGIKTNSFSDYTYIWWDLRPHPRLGTVEVRICDAQTTAGESEALGMLILACVAQAAREFDDGVKFEDLTNRMIEENLWRAVRHGLDGELLDLRRGEPYPASETVSRLLEWTAPARAELGIEISLPALNGAQRQRRMIDAGMGIAEIYASMVAQTRETYAGVVGSTAEVTG